MPQLFGKNKAFWAAQKLKKKDVKEHFQTY